MPNYMASWSVFMEADDPIDAAQKASDWAADPRNGTWRLINIDTSEVAVVDLPKKQEIKCITH